MYKTGIEHVLFVRTFQLVIYDSYDSDSRSCLLGIQGDTSL